MSYERLVELKHSWQNPYVVMLLGLVCVQILLFYPTYLSMVQIWWRSETFAHGFFIFPISIYLVWKKRNEFSCIQFETDLRASFFLLGLGFLWLIANLVDVIVVQQFAVVAMIPILVWLVLGYKALWLLAFPLGYLLFAVPVGEFLIYPMMEFTASFTVHAIRLVGVPVLWEGLFFTLPSGSWSVVEACSGVRYIIASLTLGCLYAYLTYKSLWRRTAFILISIIVPIIANGIRAFMIVMIGHFSNMKLATGVDHLVYGWVWFGIVMFLMFWIGSFWRDDFDEEKLGSSPNEKVKNTHRKPVLATVLGGVLLVIWPIWSGLALQRLDQNYSLFKLETNPGKWRLSDQELTDWSPHFVNPTYQVKQTFLSDDARVGFYLAYYGGQEGVGELVNSQNIMLEERHLTWRQPSQSKRSIILGKLTFDVIETQLDSPRQKLLVWHWNRINGQYTSNEYYSKVLEAWAQLTGKQKEGFALVFYSAYQEDQNSARVRIKQFLSDMLPTIEEQLDKMVLPKN